MRVVVVRHGVAAAKRTWDGLDVHRPLTVTGQRQAAAIAARLARHRPATIISSPTLRCTQTVEPLALRCRRQVTVRDALAPDAGPAALDLVHRLARSEPPASTVVLCTHREVLVELLPGLAAEFGVVLQHRPPGAKGSCWSLLFRHDRLTDLKYWRPDL